MFALWRSSGEGALISQPDLQAISASVPRDQVQCRVILLRASGSEVLVERSDSGMVLPTLRMARQQRVAESVNQKLRNDLGINAHCLFTIRSPNRGDGSSFYEVMESRNVDQSIPPHCAWLSVMQLSGAALSEEECSAVLGALNEVQGYVSGLTKGPFGKPGWIEELLGWVQRQIEPLGYVLSRDVRQFNASPTFALLRFETNGPAVWFKAVGEPNQRELPIVVALSRLLPVFVPRLIATHPSFHGWLTAECQGLTLQEMADVASWEKAAETLAGLQIDSRKMTGELLEAGCRDTRVHVLLDRVDPFMEVMHGLMNQQKKEFPPALSRGELLALADDIRKAAAAWVRLSIPDTLGHMDLSPGNIVVSDGHCVFLDWAEAYIGPPFFAFDFMREHFRQTQFVDDNGTARIAEQYGSKWSSLHSTEAVNEGLRLASLLAPYAYAVGTDLWRDEEQLCNSDAASYLRSLVRRMQRESRNLRERRCSCLSL